MNRPNRAQLTLALLSAELESSPESTALVGGAAPAVSGPAAAPAATAVQAQAARKSGWGGKRRGAGRKPADPKARRRVEHRKRPPHKTRHPVHITVRARPGLPSFRSENVHRMLTCILSRQQPQHRPRRKAYADDFQVVHFSIQSNHIHFIVEATGDALRAGVSGLVIAFAKRLNELLGRRRGKVWADRYHARELPTPREVRNALVYVLQNWKKHGTRVYGPLGDPHSTALRFEGWSMRVETTYYAPHPEQPPWRPVKARTWLLGAGWRDHYPAIRPSEGPR